MGKRMLFLTALCMTVVLSACARTPGGADSPDMPGSSAGSGPVSTPADSSVTDDALLYERYTDVSALPMLNVDVDDVCVFDDRTLTLEDAISNEPELLTYNLEYYTVSAQFDLLMELIGEEEGIRITMGNEEPNFEKGYYSIEETIHALSTLTAEDMERVSSYEKEYILRLINTFDLEEYVVVGAEKTPKYTEAYAEAGPQIADGQKYKFYYLFAKTAKVPEFKLYEVFWEDFFWEDTLAG